ncbi:AcrR family transcriptional regulator [Mumia flava]|uniref:AcrR family transcriptional regulator n=1 Tax=Mumia flava TaxID=1348852 RepID=A0A2M9BDS8_9ACTN|nr:TetR/AcrR family transcriptional regulator [Mumia flava]PJJ56103.1 AcrR family transcriptional regulator [Mumia flava]
MSSSPRRTVRDVARRAVQAELVSVAQELFDEFGYEDTTVDAIATAAGMSRRTFFRYFASKEELVLGKYDLLGEQLLEAFRARADDEPLWTALRGMFETVVSAAGGVNDDIPVHAIERIVDETPALRGGYLYRLESIQTTIAAEARQRAARIGAAYAPDDPAPEAMVGAAFACMSAARAISSAFDVPLTTTADRAMRAMHP